MRDGLIFFGLMVLVIVFGCVATQGKDKLHLKDVITDKQVYHSSEVLGVIVIVESGSDLENVAISVTGINGKLSEKKIVNLEKGLNEIPFSYTLPRCNVCGGIRAGDYDITCEVNYGNVKEVKIVTINIQQ